jgi:hypothetical protein
VLQVLNQGNDDRGLPGAAHNHIAHHDDGPAWVFCRQPACAVKKPASPYQRAIEP